MVGVGLVGVQRRAGEIDEERLVGLLEHIPVGAGQGGFFGERLGEKVVVEFLIRAHVEGLARMAVAFADQPVEPAGVDAPGAPGAVGVFGKEADEIPVGRVQAEIDFTPFAEAARVEQAVLDRLAERGLVLVQIRPVALIHGEVFGQEELLSLPEIGRKGRAELHRGIRHLAVRGPGPGPFLALLQRGEVQIGVGGGDVAGAAVGVGEGQARGIPFVDDADGFVDDPRLAPGIFFPEAQFFGLDGALRHVAIDRHGPGEDGGMVPILFQVVADLAVIGFGDTFLDEVFPHVGHGRRGQGDAHAKAVHFVEQLLVEERGLGRPAAAPPQVAVRLDLPDIVAEETVER